MYQMDQINKLQTIFSVRFAASVKTRRLRVAKVVEQFLMRDVARNKPASTIMELVDASENLIGLL
jgi:hypothetical protein